MMKQPLRTFDWLLLALVATAAVYLVVAGPNVSCRLTINTAPTTQAAP